MPGNDAELDFRLAELRIVRRDDEIALHRKLAAAAKREARDRGDDRLARMRGAIPSGDEVSEENIDERLVRHLLDVGAGRERLVGAGDDHAADVGVRLERIDRATQFADERAVERIERLRAVEPDEPDPAARFDQDVFVAHRTSPDWRWNRSFGFRIIFRNDKEGGGITPSRLCQ